MNHYYKRRWEESRGDAYSSWGHSWWFFETDNEYWPVRQIEIYDGGKVCTYSASRIEDEFGALGEAALDAEEFEPFRISQEVFESEWVKHHAV